MSGRMKGWTASEGKGDPGRNEVQVTPMWATGGCARVVLKGGLGAGLKRVPTNYGCEDDVISAIGLVQRLFGWESGSDQCQLLSLAAMSNNSPFRGTTTYEHLSSVFLIITFGMWEVHSLPTAVSYRSRHGCGRGWGNVLFPPATKIPYPIESWGVPGNQKETTGCTGINVGGGWFVTQFLQQTFPT